MQSSPRWYPCTASIALGGVEWGFGRARSGRRGSCAAPRGWRWCENRIGRACRRVILKIEDQPAVPVILNAIPERHQLNSLPYVRLQQHAGATEIVLRQQRPAGGIADIAAKPRGGIRVSALPHVVGPKLIDRKSVV